ncbi:MAG: UvrD-helicase domain-containing protein [Chthoniobacteraceae bacterium]
MAGNLGRRPVMIELKDQLDRERFEQEIETSFCVSAGAGVGKTTAIVNRIAEIARRQPEALSKLVVVTFARAAAEELRARARAKIFELPEFREDLGWRREVLQHWPRVFFGTIHSFCLKLMAEEGYAIGLPEDLELCEGLVEEECWHRFCESSALDACEIAGPELDGAMRFYSFEEVLKLARKLRPAEAQAILQEHQSLPMPTVTFAAALADDGGKARESTQANQQELRAWLAEFAQGGPFLKLPRFEKGSKTFKAALLEDLEPLTRWLERSLGEVAAKLALAYRDFRLEQQMASYNDQVQWAMDLVQDRAVLRRLRRRELRVILDEAQDTDAAMFSILSEIVRPVDAGAGDWRDNPELEPPRAGAFCFVGDEQQTIYSDRADPAVYAKFIHAFEQGRGGERLEFFVTMRCPVRVVETVNSVFTGQRIVQEHVTFRELSARPTARNGAVWRLPLSSPGEEGVDAGFLSECRQVAKFLRDQGTVGLGIQRWGEVAVICPRRKWLTVAADCLRDVGVPARLLSGRRCVGDHAAASWPAALAHITLHPWDEFERFGVLREVFGVSDRDYARWKRGGKKAKALQAAEQVLAQLRAVAGEETLTLSHFFERLLELAGLPARLVALGLDLQPLEALRRLTLEAECAGTSLRDWARKLRLRLEEEDPAEVESPEAVTLLTGMKAKGLEWPVVVALGLGRGIGVVSPEFPYYAEHAEAARIVIADGDLHETLKEARTEDNYAKWQREFYVTMTRAKHLLVLPDSRAFYNTKAKNRPPGSLGELCKLWELADGFSVPLKIEEAMPSVERDERPGHESPTGELVREAVRRSQQIPALVRPHELAEERVEMLEFDPATPAGGVNYGLWWHETMQFFPWTQPRARAEFLQGRLADLPAEDGMHERGVAELMAWERSEDLRTLLEQGRHFLAELPFALAHEEASWVEGVVDLVITTREGEQWVVDWKTDRREVGESDEKLGARLVEAYGAQLRVYAGAVARATGQRINRILLFRRFRAGLTRCVFDEGELGAFLAQGIFHAVEDVANEMHAEPAGAYRVERAGNDLRRVALHAEVAQAKAQPGFQLLAGEDDGPRVVEQVGVANDVGTRLVDAQHDERDVLRGPFAIGEKAGHKLAGGREIGGVADEFKTAFHRNPRARMVRSSWGSARPRCRVSAAAEAFHQPGGRCKGAVQGGGNSREAKLRVVFIERFEQAIGIDDQSFPRLKRQHMSARRDFS